MAVDSRGSVDEVRLKRVALRQRLRSFFEANPDILEGLRADFDHSANQIARATKRQTMFMLGQKSVMELLMAEEPNQEG